MSGFNGLGMGLGNLSILSNAQTRSISAENFTRRKRPWRHGYRGHRQPRGA